MYAFLKRANTQGYAKDVLYKELQCEFDKTITSIEKYGGFYIGRYETGNIRQETLVVRRMNMDIGYANWYNLYLRMRNISYNNIQTSMIWGCLWDETLQWLIDTGEKEQGEIATDSSSWGNYKNTTFLYLNGDEAHQTKEMDRYALIPTGSCERNKANNIYDLSGNVSEYTLEASREVHSADHEGRYYRGGNYTDSGNYYTAAFRDFSSAYAGENQQHGVRAFFYIK